MAKQRPYRARRVDNNEWVYGWLWEGTKRHFIMGPQADYDYEDDDDGNQRTVIYGDTHEVHPDSVSQSTGGKDKHGLEIYEGMKVGTAFWHGKVIFKRGAFVIYRSGYSDSYLNNTERLEIIPEGEEQ